MTLNELILNCGRRMTMRLQRASRPVRRLWPRVPDAMIGLFALALVLFALLTYSTTVARYTSELFSSNRYLALASGLMNPFRNRHFLLKSGLPVYDLRIGRQQYAILEHAAAQARRQGWMSDDLKIWTDARFYHGGEAYNVKVRIRGDLPNHWSGPKKSWRIKFGRNEIDEGGTHRREPIFFRGRHQINLIVPNDRDYILGYFINSLARESGLVVPRDGFAILRINGRMQGLYYEVEHFDKPLLAAQRRPETAVFGQNDRAMHFEQYTKLGTAGSSDAQFDIGSVRRLVDREGDLGLRAIQVLVDHALNPSPRNFRRVQAVLDWDKYLAFRVLTTLCNTNHVRFGSDNFRLYFDESRGLLEPVPWDLHLTRMPKEPGTIDFFNSHGPDAIERATLTDPEQRLWRNKVLWKLVSDGGDRLIARYTAIHDWIRPIAWADVLSTPIQGHKMDVHKANFEYNVHRVHKVLSLSSANATFRLEARDRAALEIASTNFSGIRLQTIQVADPATFEGTYRLYEDVNDNGELDAIDPLVAETTSVGGVVRFTLDRAVLPAVEYRHDFIDDVYWEFFDTRSGRVRFFLVGRLTRTAAQALAWHPPAIDLTATNAVTGESIPSAPIDPSEPLPNSSIGITAFDASAPFDLDAPEADLATFVRAHPQFTISPNRPGAAELQGPTTISRTVIVPKSVHLIVRPGTDITMKPAASILAYGGLTAIGTPDGRIRIHGDGSGKPWGVVAAVRPPEKVLMRHVTVRDGGQARVNGILFTGGVAVHDGNLDLEHCRFIDMQSEDSMNLKNGHLLMNDCVVAGGASDGVDLDFVTGEIRNSVFTDNGGDGVDLSGSRVTVAGNRFDRMGDKAISVGEDSHPVIVDNLIRGCQIGISTKDLSWARVAYSTFVDNTVAIEAIRKKPMFGGAGGDFINNVFSDNRTLMVEDYFSKGGIVLKSSLMDVRTDRCPTCQTGIVLPAHPVDYRLAAGAVDDHALVMTRAPWTHTGPDAGSPLPDRPGVFTDPPHAPLPYD